MAMTKDEARDLVRKRFAEAGLDTGMIEKAIEDMPDSVMEAIRKAGGVDVEVEEIDSLAGLLAMAAALRSRFPGHLPGCDGNHGHGDMPEIGIELRSAADAPDQMGEHALGNVYGIIKHALSYLALEGSDGFRRWMTEREDSDGRNRAAINRYSTAIMPSMLSWIALSLRDPHPDCPARGGGGICQDQAQQREVIEAKLPAAFRRKPRFTAGRDGLTDNGEPVIDPHSFGYHRPLK